MVKIMVKANSYKCEWVNLQLIAYIYPKVITAAAG